MEAVVSFGLLISVAIVLIDVEPTSNTNVDLCLYNAILLRRISMSWSAVTSCFSFLQHIAVMSVQLETHAFSSLVDTKIQAVRWTAQELQLPHD